MRSAFPDLYGYVEGQFVDGEVLVQRITVSGTHNGPWFGLPATGKRVSFDVIHIARVGPDGRIAEAWSVGDELGLLRQLGQVDVPGP
jgi:predicted ester cyclase